ncbi:MAG: hypothetical protein P0Y65_13415 [Candidatus Devosia phytovorans]|uniref:Uncharacterized protein n=1 Tax=Candidatus Devosia phytovorans TaxID=3121372 RepID=A0AAJ5VTI5_9HYPH|nr:hypothetical protein [Devosia sp.]WEK03198.1 MAG: hypothetical protein P0Y65_13415 [Devosia sp.]
MTHQTYSRNRDATRFADIIARDERNPTLGRQVMNGIGGLLALLALGVLIVMIVLFKSPSL